MKEKKCHSSEFQNIDQTRFIIKGKFPLFQFVFVLVYSGGLAPHALARHEIQAQSMKDTWRLPVKRFQKFGLLSLSSFFPASG